MKMEVIETKITECVTKDNFVKVSIIASIFGIIAYAIKNGYRVVIDFKNKIFSITN